MDKASRKLLDRAITSLRELLTREEKPKPKPKPKPAAAPTRELSELERVQRDFAFLREHGGILAEGKVNQWGGVDWRFRR